MAVVILSLSLVESQELMVTSRIPFFWTSSASSDVDAIAWQSAWLCNGG